MRNFENAHPVVPLVYFLSVISVAMFTVNPIIGLSAFLGGALFLTDLRRGRRRRADICFFSAMFLLTAVTNPLFSHNGKTPLFFLNGSPITLEAAAYGVGIAVTLVTVLLFCSAFSEIMTEDKFTYLLGRAVPRLSLILSMAIRLIPRFIRRMREVSAARRALGIRSSESYADRVRDAVRVFYAVTSWSAEKSIDASSAMKARGYGLPARTSFSPFRFGRSDAALLAVSCVLCAVTLVGIGSGACDFSYYPEISAPPFGAAAVLTYMAFGVLSFLPFLINLKDDLKWKYYVSRI